MGTGIKGDNLWQTLIQNVHMVFQMEKHICPLCRKESDCLYPNCDDASLRYEWCNMCRIKVTHYLTGLSFLTIL